MFIDQIEFLSLSFLDLISVCPKFQSQLHNIFSNSDFLQQHLKMKPHPHRRALCLWVNRLGQQGQSLASYAWACWADCQYVANCRLCTGHAVLLGAERGAAGML